MDNTPSLPDTRQTFWHLTCIQGAALSIPTLVLGANFRPQFGNGTCFLSICIGNLILWLVGMAIISMNYGERRHAIENVIGYLGKFGGIFAAISLTLAFLTWYALELKATVSILEQLFNIDTSQGQGFTLRIGAAIGALTALLAIGGIKGIRYICTIVFPLAALYVLSMLVIHGKIPPFYGTWGISGLIITSTITLNLPGFINLPTFFRHSKSRVHSFLALTLLTVIDIFFESAALFLPDRLYWQMATPSIFSMIPAFAFVIMSCICLNLVNIYFASASGEVFLYRNWSAKEYTIIGLLGTAVYAFLQNVFPMMFLENMTNHFISILGIVLLIAYLARNIVHHRPRPLEKAVTNFCWFVGCAVSLTGLIQNPADPYNALFNGMGSSVLAFLVIIFVEETAWVVNKVWNEER